MDENAISTDIQNRHPTQFTDQTFNMVERTAKSDCEHSNEQNTLFTNSIELSEESHREPISRDEIVQSGSHTSAHTNLTRLSSDVHMSVDTYQHASSIHLEEINLVDDSENETDKNLQSTMKQKISKQLKEMSPHILQLVIIGLVCYFICNKNGASHVSKRESTFFNLKVNFDLYSIETKFGKVPWRPIEATFVALEENGTKICVLHPASYSIDVMLNLDNRRNKDSFAVSVCILNSRDRNGNRCIPEVLPAHMQRSVTAGVNLNLQKGDTIWVSVIGLNLVYERADVNSMSIRKYDT